MGIDTTKYKMFHSSCQKTAVSLQFFMIQYVSIIIHHYTHVLYIWTSSCCCSHCLVLVIFDAQHLTKCALHFWASNQMCSTFDSKMCVNVKVTWKIRSSVISQSGTHPHLFCIIAMRRAWVQLSLNQQENSRELGLCIKYWVLVFFHCFNKMACLL